MLRLIYILPFISLAQVGIGTTSPTAMLDIDTIPGQYTLRVRGLEPMVSDRYLVVDNDGNVGYSDTSGSGIINAAESVTLVSSTPVDYIATNGFQLNDAIDIGHLATVIIPANTTAIIRTEYNIPLGIATSNANPSAYIGIRMTRNGFTIEEASRKFSIGAQYPRPNGNIYEMGYITCSYSEVYPNPTPFDDVIVYVAYGYVEQGYIETTECRYRFNMWAAPGNPNYNWGRAYIHHKLLRI
ncbi:hypothetical protein MG296_10545 [Flavobacteriaceae bacterium TK19130]|nr:hypothetical protein [Thermobacterium salinum]